MTTPSTPPSSIAGSAPPRAGDWLDRLPPWAPYAIFLLVPLAVYPPGFIAAGMMDGWDDAYSFMPYLYYSARKLFTGEVLWTTDILLGAPVVKEPEFAVFYPLRLVIPPLGPTRGFAAYLILHYVIGQVGAYLYLREIGLRRPAAIFGAIAYGLRGFAMGPRWITMFLTATAWPPLFLYFIERARKGKGGRGVYLGAALSYAAVPLCGALQLSTYLASMTVILYGVLARLKRSWRPLAVALAALVPAGLITLLQGLPAMDLSRSLAMGNRGELAFITDGSYHPALLPTMLLPLPLPHYIATEYYTHCGVAVFLGAAVAFFTRRREPLVRAWLAVAAVALVLMFGRHVPLIQAFLHELPVVSVFRYPVRHGYELGTALAVLAAFGLDHLLRGGKLPGSSGRWAIALAVIVAGGAWAISGYDPGEEVEGDIVAYLSLVQPAHALLPLGLGLAWLAVASSRRPRVFAGLGAVSAGVTVLAAALAMHLGLQPPTDWQAQIDRADFRQDRSKFARVLTVSFPPLGLDSLASNAALLVDGVQNVSADTAVAPRDIVTMMDMDYSGFPKDIDDLRWSRLPSIFGVTHLIMPRMLCGNTVFALDDLARETRICTRGGVPDSFDLGTDEAACSVKVTDEMVTYALRADVETKGGAPPRLLVKVFDPDDDDPEITFRDELQNAGIEGKPQVYEVSLALARLPPSPRLRVSAKGAGPMTVRRLRLVGFRWEPVAAASVERLAELPTGVTRGPGGALHVHARPGGSRTIDLPARWPSDSSNTVLEIAATLAVAPGEAPPRRVRLSLEGDGEYDREAATVDVDRETLAAGEASVAHPFVLATRPGRARLRITVTGGAVVIRRAYLLSYVAVRRRARPVPLKPDDRMRPGGGAVVEKGGIRFPRGRGFVELPVYTPRRPLRVEIGAPVLPMNRPFVELEARTGERSWGEPRTLYGGALPVARSHSWTFTVAPDVTETAVSVAPYGRGRVRVEGMTVATRCPERGYAEAAALNGGLFLHRNKGAMPRAYTVSEVFPVRGVQEARRILRDAPAFDPRRVALVHGPGASARRFDAGKVLSASFTQQRVAVRVAGGKRGTFLVVNDRYDPGWRAAVDGKPAPIVRANGIVRGVYVPPGEHRVDMWYPVPRSVLMGAGAAVLGIAVALLLPWLDRNLFRRVWPR